ncbi:MAG TPA: DUF917 domain-containing protein [Actinomycetota bacterium]
MSIGPDDVRALARGCAVLGAGGGGDTAAGILMAETALRAHGPVEVVGVEDLPPDGVVMPCGGIGAPVVSFEKLEAGDEGDRLRDEVERLGRREVVALMASEIGGSNGLVPIAWAARAGLPVLDADGMGRAFPEVQMVSMELAGIAPSPAVLTDERGAVVVIRASEGAELERLERAVCVAMGGTASGADYVMTAAEARDATIPGTVTAALRIGRSIEAADDPIGALVAGIGAVPLVAGKVVDVERRLVGGFVRGAATVEGLRTDAGREVRIHVQNEYLVAREGDRVLAVVPDLITVLDTETADAVPTERLRYGQRVTVVGIPCAPVWRTPRGLEVAGPAAFGEDVAYVPVERLRG